MADLIMHEREEDEYSDSSNSEDEPGEQDWEKWKWPVLARVPPLLSCTHTLHLLAVERFTALVCLAAWTQWWRVHAEVNCLQEQTPSKWVKLRNSQPKFQQRVSKCDFCWTVELL